MARSFGRGRRGFTIIELMIVVVILGVLAATAIPAYIKFIRRSQTAEAEEKLSNLFRSSAAYFAGEQTKRSAKGIAIGNQFPNNQALTPGGTCDFCAGGIGANRCTPAGSFWDVDTWQALDFAITDPHYFTYQYIAGGILATSSFSARAHADLDGDTTCSTFERTAYVTADLHVSGGRGIWRRFPTE